MMSWVLLLHLLLLLPDVSVWFSSSALFKPQLPFVSFSFLFSHTFFTLSIFISLYFKVDFLIVLVVQYKLPWLPESFHLYGEIPSRKGKYPMLRTNTKPHQLIKHANISYSIASLVFHKFSYRTYRNGLNRVPQSWGTTSISKSTNRVSSIPFVRNWHFNILLHRVRYLKILFMSRRKAIIFPGEFKLRN